MASHRRKAINYRGGGHSAARPVSLTRPEPCLRSQPMLPHFLRQPFGTAGTWAGGEGRAERKGGESLRKVALCLAPGHSSQLRWGRRASSLQCPSLDTPTPPHTASQDSLEQIPQRGNVPEAGAVSRNSGHRFPRLRACTGAAFPPTSGTDLICARRSVRRKPASLFLQWFTRSVNITKRRLRLRDSWAHTVVRRNVSRPRGACSPAG